MTTWQERARKASNVHGKYDANVSRNARGGSKQIGARVGSGVGNPARFVLATFPEYKGNKRMLERALASVNAYCDKTGKFPDRVTARLNMGLSRVS